MDMICADGLWNGALIHQRGNMCLQNVSERGREFKKEPMNFCCLFGNLGSRRLRFHDITFKLLVQCNDGNY